MVCFDTPIRCEGGDEALVFNEAGGYGLVPTVSDAHRAIHVDLSGESILRAERCRLYITSAPNLGAFIPTGQLSRLRHELSNAVSSSRCNDSRPLRDENRPRLVLSCAALHWGSSFQNNGGGCVLAILDQ